MKTKILFVIPSLRGGGAEKVIVTLLNNFNRGKYELHLAIVNLTGEYTSLLTEDVHVHNLNSTRVRNAIFPLIRLIKKLKPKVVLSTLGQLNILLLIIKGLFPKQTKLIVREATIVSEAIKSGDMTKKWVKLYKLFYPRADAIISQSEYMRQDLINIIGISSDKIYKIYNPVEIEKINQLAIKDENPLNHIEGSPIIVSFGRLEEVKGYDRLIRKIPEIIKNFPNLKLFIFGNGSQKGKLTNLITELKLEQNVYINGFESNPYKWMKNADLFTLTSYYEGLPNVLLEAIACECPILAWDHPGGTREVIELLGLNDRMLTDFNLSNYHLDTMNVQDKLKKHFDVNIIVTQYEQLINNVTNS